MKKYILFVLFAMLYSTASFAYIGPKHAKHKSNSKSVNLRAECDPGTKQAIQSINNVRATLLNSGDVWWNLVEGQYFVPQVPVGEEPTSSIYAGAVWIGGYEPVEGGVDILKIAANTYRSQEGTDFYPGPLDDNTGATEKEICEDWDKFFTVTGAEINRHRINYNFFISSGQDYPKDSIPDNVRYWPGIGNDEFADEYGFTLPAAGQGLGSFFDHPDSQLDKYDPENGDYPIIEVRGCEEFAQYPDQMFFWIYNDQGGGATHESTQGDAIQMEVQVQAFAYQSNDELNDMTFQRYKLINRAQTVIKDCYFAIWIDGDLGCSSDDYIGCDTSRSMAILYNQDEIDGEDGGSNCGGVSTYSDDVPILGVDYFRGPLKPQIWNEDSTMLLDLINPFDEPDTFVEIGMTSFVYTNRQGEGEHPPGTWDAETAEEHYNLLDGKWRDGLPITFGNSGYNIGETDTIRYVLPGRPADNNSWSMCSAGLGQGDRRTIQASGPFILKQGAVNELIVGVVWVPSQTYPCPQLGDLNKADDLAQALFDNCFQTLDGPDGPDVDIIELDREIIMILTNDTILSNNKYEEYSEVDIFATDSIAKTLPDSLKSYKFEGYIVYQLINSTATSDLDDISKARIVRQVDVSNGITTLYNWDSEPNPLPGGENKLIYSPEIATVGNDNDIKHSFVFTQDAFDQGDSKLVNHREYYYYVVAYGYNEYFEFDPFTGLGQQRPFISGRRTFGVVTAVPRPMVYDALNTYYGDGPQITRKSGTGNQSKFVELEDGMYDKILANNVESDVVYKDGMGPLDVKIVNPLDVKDAKFTLELTGPFDDDDGELQPSSTSKWTLTDQESGEVFTSSTSLDVVNERILREYGISINVSRIPDVSDIPNEERSGNFIGGSIEYDDPTSNRWLTFMPSGGFSNFTTPFLSFIDNTDKNVWDPTGDFSSTDGVNMVPLKLANADTPKITPANRSATSVASLAQNQMSMGDLNNVDIVFTSDKSKWSKCLVIETAHADFFDAGYASEGNAVMWNLRSHNSISKEVDNDGNPQDAGGDDGFGYFPGYAVDVETGERLNIFYGENSTYGGDYADVVGGEFGRDMIWNPNSNMVLPTPEGKDQSIWDLYTGGQHMIYVTRTEYDEGKEMYELLKPGSSGTKLRNAMRTVTWTGIPVVAEGVDMLSYSDGLIPNRAVVKLRVDNAFGRELDYDSNVSFDVVNENPIYELEIRGKNPTAVTADNIDEALSNVNAVPNPYYGASTYELGQNDARVKITNIPSKAVVTIYSIDGQFITQFKRDARRTAVQRSTAGVNFTQEDASIVWNLKNSAGIPISSGVYLIHVLDEETGAQKTIKWFGINRKFDPSGL